MTTAGILTSRLGTGQMVAGAGVMIAAGMVLAGLGAGVLTSVPVTVAGLVAIGYASGSCDVAMNVEAAMVERRLGRTVMPRFHAGWSIGTVTGAGIGALAARIGSPIQVSLVVVALVVMVG